MLVSTMAVQGLEPAASPWGSIGRTLVGLLVHFMITTSTDMWPPLQAVSSPLRIGSCAMLLGELLPDSQMMMMHHCCCRCSP